jgi:hypothetical protein
MKVSLKKVVANYVKHWLIREHLILTGFHLSLHIKFKQNSFVNVFRVISFKCLFSSILVL